jgi:hypothetical protein
LVKIIEALKTTITILAILICTTAYGQLDKFKGTWVSSAQDVMIINDTIKSSMLCTIDKDENMKLYLMGNTLSFQNKYSSSATNFEKIYTDKYDLIILQQTDTSLTVSPSSKFSKKFFNNRDNITFIKQEFNRDQSIVFEKIVYHTTRCYGSCPTIDMEINNDKSIYLEGEFYKSRGYGKDSIRTGQFIGKLSDTVFNELVNLLQTCNLRTLTFPEKHGADAPVTTLIIYYNGQRKYLKSMFPPTVARELINFLYHLNERTNLTRTDEKRTIEE